MSLDADRVGLAIVLTGFIGIVLSGFAAISTERGWRLRNFHRPGGVAALVGVSIVCLSAPNGRHNAFVAVAAGAAAVSGLSLVRKSGQLGSFLGLWVASTLVVATIGDSAGLSGHRPVDVVVGGLLIAGLCAVIREADATGPYGWATGLILAIMLGVLAHQLGDPADARLAWLSAGALFGVVSAVPLGAGMLGRTGSRFVGLVVGGIALRTVAGDTDPSVWFAVVGGVCLVIVALSASRGHVRVTTVGAVIVASVVAVAVPMALATADLNPPAPTRVRLAYEFDVVTVLQVGFAALAAVIALGMGVARLRNETSASKAVQHRSGESISGTRSGFQEEAGLR